MSEAAVLMKQRWHAREDTREQAPENADHAIRQREVSERKKQRLRPEADETETDPAPPR
jgi:hypothetical protein